MKRIKKIRPKLKAKLKKKEVPQAAELSKEEVRALRRKERKKKKRRR